MANDGNKTRGLKIGFLVDKFGQYKPVVVLAFILNAAFHHSLLLIPPMETPGEVPQPYIARHPVTGLMEVWWSPCPSRECPSEEELEVVLERCFSHCELLMSAAHHVVNLKMDITFSKEICL